MSVPFPEPCLPASSRADVFLRYLEYFRSRIVSKLGSMTDGQLRRSRLPSGWTPLELLHHLAYVELRWLEWRFEGRDVAEPWADERDGRLYVDPARTLPELVEALQAQAERSRAIIEAHDLADVGRPGDRWDAGRPAELERVLLHLLQEYARHLGHLDIVAEVAGGEIGE
jgi:uncharacterized damage-inducible protein DinB